MSSSTKRADGARLSRADVALRIATLARLELSEAELDLFQRQLGGILDFATTIQNINTDGVPPYASTITS